MRLPATKDLLHQKFQSGETVLYDSDSKRVLCLNPESASVWQLCIKRAPFQEAVSLVEELFQIADGEPIVWSALHRFQKHGLLDEEIQVPNEPAYTSRRKFLRSFGALD